MGAGPEAGPMGDARDASTGRVDAPGWRRSWRMAWDLCVDLAVSIISILLLLWLFLPFIVREYLDNHAVFPILYGVLILSLTVVVIVTGMNSYYWAVLLHASRGMVYKMVRLTIGDYDKVELPFAERFPGLETMNENRSVRTGLPFPSLVLLLNKANKVLSDGDLTIIATTPRRQISDYNRLSVYVLVGQESGVARDVLAIIDEILGRLQARSDAARPFKI